jgi:cytochrome P450
VAPTSVGDLRLEPGEGVVCGLAAANRDPRYVDDPDTLLLARGAPTHVAFGNGIHYCLGAPLARLEGQVVFARMVQRFPTIELVDPDPPYREHFVLRGLASLPVSLGAG